MTEQWVDYPDDVNYQDAYEWRGYSLPTPFELHTQGNINLSVLGILTGFPRHKVATWYSCRARRALLRGAKHR